MAQVKYIAKGFLNDASKLLDEFFEKNSLEFSVFADVWKKHSFSFVYAGRENVIELNQFTQEIFKRVTVFLLSSSFKKQVGAAFLLYALCRNQITESVVPIRVEMHVFRTLKSIRKKAVEEKMTSLHYVLDYLFDNALILVAYQSLKGPTLHNVEKRFEPPPIGNPRLLFRSALEDFRKSELLEDLLDSFASYGEHRNSNQWRFASGKIQQFMDGDRHHLNRCEVFRQVSNDLAVAAEVSGNSAATAEVGDNSVASAEISEPVVAEEVISGPAVVSLNGIGSRRAELKLKACQFATNSKGSDFPTEAKYSTAFWDAEKVRVCKTRCSKKSKLKEEDQQRKESDVDSDESLAEFLKSKLPKPSARRRHEKPLRVRRYYKEEPSNR